MTDLRELAERVEALEGPSREVDAEILVAIDWRWPDHEEGDITPKIVSDKRGLEWLTGRMLNSNSSIWRNLPSPTASLDAAMSLVPEGWAIDLRTFVTAPGAIAMVHPGERPTETARAATPALALTAAALRAIASQKEKG